MMNLYHEMSHRCGRVVTECYSTSFASAVRLLHRDLREAIYSIYGLVRIADEIVDTFHDQDKQLLLSGFREETFAAVETGISLNPILHGFQLTVRKYEIDRTLIRAFFSSMEMDIYQTRHDDASYSRYIYGSAEAVGLMCLCVFCEGDQLLYERLSPYARSLGAAFQKVNFLRDLGSDHQQLNRNYFPDDSGGLLTRRKKQTIEKEIMTDFQHAEMGISQLPPKARLGVYVAYKYYLKLFKKIRGIAPMEILEKRVRIPNYQKWIILLGAGLRHQLK
jgi:phytoene/squalene synthetase